jgi:NAD(P)-dependent dehydrogenase (short-subunit alcohol dehydrogenase family)
METTMQGKVCVITGATSGLGLEAAERLAKLGARLVLVGRDQARGEAALQRLRAAAPGLAATIHYADLSRLSEMKRLGDEIAKAEPRIDALINNAGAMFAGRHVTEDGLELTFALNHMAYFVVTERLLPSLKAAAPSRIVSTASGAHRGQQLDFADLQAARSYSGMRVYGRSKLANILFTRELARRIAGSGVTANCLHPGFVATRFGSGNNLLVRIGMRIAMLGAIKVEDGAETIVYLASSPEVASSSGGYFYRSRPATPSQAARDDAAARRLWDESEKIAAA